jgi:hypothetical protein
MSKELFQELDHTKTEQKISCVHIKIVQFYYVLASKSHVNMTPLLQVACSLIMFVETCMPVTHTGSVHL